MTYLESKYTHDTLKANNLIIAEAIVGSVAFNLNNAESDVDLYGIYRMNVDDFLSLHYRTDSAYKDVVEKTNPHDPDITYWEVGKFIELLANNNPNALELLAAIQNEKTNRMPDSSFFQSLNFKEILSKRCQKTFGEYAIAQIKKARGLNKKIVNPMAEERRTPLDFCKILINGQTKDLKSYLSNKGFNQKFCGVVALSNAKDAYAIYYDWVSHNLFNYSEQELKDNLNDCNSIIQEIKNTRKEKGLPMGYGFKGIEMENSNEIRLSSIPDMDKLPIEDQGGWIEFIGHISYNKDGYMTHCKDYEDYWKWTKNRNPVRHKHNEKQNYDTKNISHCIRLLSVAKEIGEGKGLILRRTDDRQFLMDVKYGLVDYETAMSYAENIMNCLPDIYKNSTLREQPNFDYLNEILVNYRKLFYKIK